MRKYVPNKHTKKLIFRKHKESLCSKLFHTSANSQTDDKVIFFPRKRDVSTEENQRISFFRR